MPRDFAQHLTEFEQKGLTCFPNQLDKSTIEQWQSIFQNEALDPKPDRKRYDTYQLIDKYPQTTIPFVSNAEVLDFLEMLMGPFVSLEALAMAATFPTQTDPNEVDYGIHWHRDMWTTVGWTSDYLPPNAVNVLNYFPNLNQDNGAFRYIPGSHRKHFFITGNQAQEAHSEEKLLYPKMGDTLLVHSGLLHSGSGNFSGQMRYFVSRFYAKCWYPRREQTNISPIQSFIANAESKRDRRLMRLFGKDDLLLSRAGQNGSLPESEIWQQWISEDQQYKLAEKTT